MVTWAVCGGSGPHSWSMIESTDTTSPGRTSSVVSTARCMGAVTGMCAPLCHTSTGPRMRKSTRAPSPVSSVHATNALRRRYGLGDRRRDPRTMKVIVTGLLLLALAPPVAAAQPPEEDTGLGSVMLVLDASGSMTAPLTTGGTRMDAAKQAMTTLVDGLPVNMNVGLEVYGTGTGDS